MVKEAVTLEMDGVRTDDLSQSVRIGCFRFDEQNFRAYFPESDEKEPQCVSD